MGEMAQKIVKIDNEELLKILNQAFAEEWLAYYQYWVGAQVAVGPMRTSVIAEFEEHADEELKHAKWLSERIVQLGGVPLLNPKDWEHTAKCKYEIPDKPYIMNLLKQNLIAERCAIARYQGICEMTFGKDYETFRISAKILKEELQHEQEMGDFIDDIKAGMEHGAMLQS